MPARIDRLYRQAATGLAFACFFVGGAIMACAVFPLLGTDRSQRRLRVRAIIHHTFRIYLAILCWAGLLRLEIVGRDRLGDRQGRVVIANHPSLLDVVMLMALIPDAQCIIKHELWSSPYLGRVMRSAGYIRNDLEGDLLIEECRDALRRKTNIIVFPEGTRSKDEGMPRFRRGFANIAILTGADIQPVIITCTPPTLRKGERWWIVPAERPTFKVVVDEPLPSSTYLDGSARGIASRRLVARLEAYYAECLSNG